LLFLEDLR